MFDLSQASEGSVQINYQKVGIYDNVMISEVVLEKTTKNFIDYMRLITKGTNGEVGTSAKMFLSTEIKNNEDGTPKKTSGWGVTARNLIELIKSTNNIDEDSAVAMIKGIPSKETLAQKVSAILVGKPFRGKFKGTTNEKGYIYPELSQSESMRVNPTKMYFDATRDVKPYILPSNTTNSFETSSVNSDIDPLPF